MNKLNVFNQYYSPWKYFSNWSGNFRLFFRQFKWAYQRITCGYCDYDVWDLDQYYLNIFYETLNKLADITHGYPGTEEFPTPELWENYLREMAMDFYRGNETNDYYPHPLEDSWWEEIKDLKEPWNYHSPKSKAMCNEAIELEKKRINDINTGFDKMKHVFGHLWD